MCRVLVSPLVFALLLVLKNSDGFPISKYMPLIQEGEKLYDFLTFSLRTYGSPATVDDLKPEFRNMLLIMTTIHMVAAKTVNGEDLDAVYDKTRVEDDTLEAILKKAKELLTSPLIKKSVVSKVKSAINFCSSANCDNIADGVIKKYVKKFKLPSNLPSLVQNALDEYLKIEDVIKEAVRNDPKAFLISSKQDLKPLIHSVANVEKVLKNANIDVRY